ncbi:MAG: beta-ketoacyl synthase chain length factor [Thermohalobaculum sp.]|nr:beta-ketoacyl synthase chain length factor [Thermohalobaculum sp.]
MTARLYVNAVGFAAPGIESAEALRRHLAGAASAPAEGWAPMPACLARRQALRLSEATRIALMAAEQIGAHVPRDGAWVFASSTGEGGTLAEILTALRGDEIMIQPIRFQNAVHNAAQGQWSIIAGATGPMTSIAAYDETAGAGLLKAMLQATIDGTAVGLVVFDAPMPEPLLEKRPIGLPMAASLALSPAETPGSIAALDLTVVTGTAATPSTPPQAADSLTASGNPVRVLLPLLQRILSPDGSEITLALPGDAALRITAMEAADAR